MHKPLVLEAENGFILTASMKVSHAFLWFYKYVGVEGCSGLGKKLGKDMGLVAKEVKSMTQAQILDFHKAGKGLFAGHELGLLDIKVGYCIFNFSDVVDDRDCFHT